MTRPALECVLLPGWSMEAACLQPLAQGLGPGARCVDLPGQGQRAGEVLPDTLDGLARALERDLADGTVLIGWSLGAMAALQIAARGRCRPAAIVLVTPTPRFLAAPDWAHGVDSGLLDRYDDAVRRDARALRDEFATLLLVGDARRATAARQLRDLRREAPVPDAGTLAAGLAILRHSDLRPACGAVSTPALVVAGSGDRVTPQGAARWLASTLPRATRVELATAGHALPLSHVAELAAAISGYLSHLAAGAGTPEP